MALDKEEVVDASRRGGPDAVPEPLVRAERRVPVLDRRRREAHRSVAQRPIAADEEVTFDYRGRARSRVKPRVDGVGRPPTIHAMNAP